MSRPASQQLELEVVRVESPPTPYARGEPARPISKALGPRLALSPDEAAALLGVSRDYFDEHVIDELRVVRRGRRILVALAELERWLDQSATRATPRTSLMAEGIEVRHARSCASRAGKRCNCDPGYRVAAYDAMSRAQGLEDIQDALRGSSLARRGAHVQASKGVRLAGTSADAPRGR